MDGEIRSDCIISKIRLTWQISLSFHYSWQPINVTLFSNFLRYFQMLYVNKSFTCHLIWQWYMQSRWRFLRPIMVTKGLYLVNEVHFHYNDARHIKPTKSIHLQSNLGHIFHQRQDIIKIHLSYFMTVPYFISSKLHKRCKHRFIPLNLLSSLYFVNLILYKASVNIIFCYPGSTVLCLFHSH